MDIGTIEASLKLRNEGSKVVAEFGKDLQNLSKVGQEVGASLTRLGGIMTAAVALPLAGIVKVSKDFESAFANVVKTVEGFDTDAFNNLNDDAAAFREQIRALAPELATSASELANIAAIGGQFGVAKEDLIDFTETVAKLGVAIDGIEASTAAASLAQIANITREGSGAFTEYANILVELGNKGSSTEAIILEFAQRLAGAGKAAGLSGSEIFGLGAAMANVGLNAEAGGTAMSRLLSQMSKAGAEGAEASQKFADFAGRIDKTVTSGKAFSELFSRDASQALQLFFDGLSDAAQSGQNLNVILSDLGVSEVRQRDTTIRLAQAQGELGKQFGLAAAEAQKQSALNEEFRKKLATFEKQWESFKARIVDVAIELGGPLLTALRSTLDAMKPVIAIVADLARAFTSLPTGVQGVIGSLGLGAGLAGVLLLLGGRVVAATADIWRLVAAIKALIVAEAAAGGGALTATLAKLGGALGSVQTAAAAGAAGLAGVATAGIGLTAAYDVVTRAQERLFGSFREGARGIAGNVAGQQALANVTKATAAAANDAAVATQRGTDALGAAQKALASLSRDKKADIDAWFKLGLTMQEVSQKTKISEEVLTLYQAAAKTASTATRDLSKDVEKMRDALFGGEAIDQAKTFAKILGEVSNARLVDPAKAQEAITFLETAIDTVQRLGFAATKTTADQLASWQALLPPLKDVVKAYDDTRDITESMGKTAVAGIAKVEKATVELSAESLKLSKRIREVNDQLKDRQATQGLSREYRDLAEMTSEFARKLEDLQEEAAGADPALRGMYDRLIAIEKANFADEFSELAVKTREFAMTVFAINPQLGTLVFHLQNIEDASEQGARGVRNVAKEAENARREMFAFGESIGNAITSAVRAGEGFSGIIANVGQVLVSQLTKSISDSVTKGVESGAKNVSLGGSFAAGLGAGVATAIVSTWVDVLIGFIQDKDGKMIAAGRALAEQFAAGLGGPQAARAVLEAAGATVDQVNRLFSGGGTPEEFTKRLNEVMPLLNRYTELMKGLGVAMEGVNKLSEGLGLSLTKSMEAQDAAAQAAFDALQKLRKEQGMSQEQLDQAQKQFSEAQKARTYEATESQIAQYNRLGTIVAGVLANTVGRTGDIVTAVLEMGPALEQLAEAQTKFGLTEQTSAATQAVIDLYKTISDNEDVFTSVAGIGQVMKGLGDGIIYSTDLANAFGGELSAAFQTLTERGVDANLALATMAPQLQQLWELSKNGKIILDETTQALLDQAEAAGVVGEQQRDVNLQVLDILTEIRDMFAESLPVAIAITRDSMGEVGTEVDNVRQRFPPVQKAVDDLGKSATAATKSVAAAGREAGKAATDAAAAAKKASKEATEATDDMSRAQARQQAEAAQEAERVWREAIKRTRIEIGKIDDDELKIPIDFDIPDWTWKPPKVTVPVELKLPPGVDPGNMPDVITPEEVERRRRQYPTDEQAFGMSTPVVRDYGDTSALTTSRQPAPPAFAQSQQIIVVNMDGERIAGVVAKNLPALVELHISD